MRDAVNGTAGRKNNPRNVGISHGVEKLKRPDDIIVVILGRIINGLTHVGRRRKMEHRLYFKCAHQLRHSASVSHIRLYEGVTAQKLGAPGTEVVHDNHGMMARGLQLSDAMAANISGASGDENRHSVRVSNTTGPYGAECAKGIIPSQL
jgi:hypothetical protein